MKKTMRRILLAAFGFVFALSLFVFAACAKTENTETKTAKLTLDAGSGGTLAVTEYDVEIGSNLADYLKDKIPTAESELDFGGWFTEDGKLEDDAKMPEGGLSLKAKYLASYTVNLYKQGTDGTYGEPETVNGTAWYGESFAYEYSLEHFSLDENAENHVSSEHLGKNEVFSLYLARDTYQLIYYPNSPNGEGVGGDVTMLSGFYGQTVNISDCNLKINGYRFAGWADSPSGAVAYAVGDQFMLEADVILYAVWDKGYTDIHGGADLIYLPRTQEGVAILERAGLAEKTGVYNENTRIFTFTPIEGKTLSGRISSDGETFSWYDSDAEVVYVGYDYRTGALLDGVSLALDGYDGAVYTKEGVPQHGIFLVDAKSGDLHFVPDDGGDGFYFRVGEKDDKDIFYQRDSAYGVYYTLDGDSFTVPKLELDGFGKAIYTDSYGTSDATYTLGEDNVITLVVREDYGGGFYFDTTYYYKLSYVSAWNPSTGAYGAIGVITERGNELGTYEGGNGASLVLDGFGGATYTPAEGAPLKGTYTTITTYYDDFYDEYALLSFTSEDGTAFGFLLLLDDKTFTLTGAETGEYGLLFAAGDYTTAKLRLYGNGTAELLFLFTSSYYGNYYDVGMTGTYVATENAGEYHFTMTKLASGKTLTDAILAQYSDFLFVLSEVMDTPYFSQYLASAKLELTANGATLSLDGYGRAVYTEAGGAVHNCLFEIVRTVYYLVDVESGDVFKFRLEYNEENVVGFVAAGGEAGEYLLYLNGKIGPDYLFLDGDGKAVLCEYENSTLNETVGTYTLTDGVFVFHADGVTFKFILDELVSGGNFYPIFVKEDTSLTHVYHIEGGGTITADAYGSAVWVDAFGVQYSGLLAESDGLLLFYVEGNGGYSEMVVFELLEAGESSSVIVRVNEEVGIYHLLENSIIRDATIVLDGHGGAKLLDDDGKLIAEGTYETVGTDEYVFTPHSNYPSAKSFRFQLGLVNTNDGTQAYVYVIFTEGWKLSLTSKTEGDWSVIILDGYRNAYFTNERGVVTVYEYEAMDNTVYRIANLAAGHFDYYRINRAALTFEVITDDFILSDDGTVLLAYVGQSTQVVVPASVTRIGMDAFFGTKVAQVDLNNAEIVGESAFEWCSLTSVTAPKVRVIETYAFYGNLYLQEISLPMIESIGEAAFRYCSELASVTLGANLSSIEARAFLDLAKNAVVNFAGTTPPAVEEDVFDVAGTKAILLCVKDAATACAFYAAADWSSYALCICLAEEEPANYYTVKLDGTFTFDGRAKLNGTVLGVYVKNGNSVTVYSCEDGSSRVGTINDGTFTFEGVTYLLEGTVVTYTDETDPEIKLIFELGLGTVEGSYGGENITLTIGDTITFVLNGNTYTVTLKDDYLFSAEKAFTPVSKTYTGKEESRSKLALQFNDAEGTDVDILEGTTMRIAGRSLQYRPTGTVKYDKPVKVRDGVYSLKITSTARVNGTGSITVYYYAEITLNDEDNTFSYTSSIEYPTISMADGTQAKLTVSYAKDTATVSAVSLSLGDNENVALTFEASGTSTLTITITVTEDGVAGTYTATLTTSTSTLTLVKAAD